MDLTKPALDVGMFTLHLDEQIAFWSRVVHLPGEPMLKLGGGIHQHRFSVGSSVLKVNHSREALTGNGSGIAGISLVRPGLSAPMALRDPDGQQVTLLPADGGDGAELVV